MFRPRLAKWVLTCSSHSSSSLRPLSPSAPRSLFFQSATNHANNTINYHSCRSLSTKTQNEPTALVNKDLHSPLVKHIRDMIKISGPISVAQYMRQALTNPIDGYYMKKDVFGVKGDFTTSPEISQLFGEMLGIWFVTQWNAMGCPPKVQIIEFGPGRGTLMADMLRILKNFPALFKAIQSVHLIEASPALKSAQAKTILGKAHSFSSPSSPGQADVTQTISLNGIDYCWHSSLASVPKNGFEFITAHEFFDAMPVYKFERTSQGWREILVDIDVNEVSKSPFRLTLAPGPTNASTILPPNPPLPTTPGRLEISPDSYAVSQLIASRVALGGSALIIDYGKYAASGDSLRGIKNHQFVDYLLDAGNVDLSVDVDFKYLSDAIQEKATAHGPISQRDFLHRMGITARLDQVLAVAPSPEVQQDLVDGYKRITDAMTMGTVYKVMAVTPKEQMSMPAAFEEEIGRDAISGKVESPSRSSSSSDSTTTATTTTASSPSHSSKINDGA